MIIQNVSKMLTVLADSSKHYATLKPGEKTYLDDALLTVDCIANPIHGGLIKVVEKGGIAAPAISVKVPARAAKVEDFIAKFSAREKEEDESNEGVITATNPEDSADYTPPSKKKKGRVENIGQKLVRGKTRKKLIPMVKTSVETKQDVVKKKANFIKMSGDGGDVALDTGSVDGSLIINESGVPGQARVVSINDANAEDIDRAAKLTNRVIDEAAKDRKLAIYMSGDQTVREKFIEKTSDVEFLKEVAKIEWQGEIAKSIRGKLAELGAGDE